MNRTEIYTILEKSQSFLNKKQILKLQNILKELENNNKVIPSNEELLNLFKTAKSVEGCSPKSLKYYVYILNGFINKIDKSADNITTDDIRNYLDNISNNISRVSLDNIRRVISSYFSWLEQEDYIRKNPVARIHKIKAIKTIKKTYTDENVETLIDNCNSLRDKAIVELLQSTGIRVGEFCLLYTSDAADE